MQYGLDDDYIRMLKRYFDFDENVIEARLYGSRADGTYKRTSDIDFAVRLLDPRYIGTLMEGLYNLPTPYKFDVVNYDRISSKEFKDEIDKTSILFYKRPGPYERIFMILKEDLSMKFKKLLKFVGFKK